MDFKILPLKEQDVDALLEIESASFSDPWGKSSFLEQIKNPLSKNFGAFVGDTLVGFIVGIAVLDEASIYIVATKKECRKTGVGRALIRQFSEECGKTGATRIYLEVRSRNEGAIKFYEALGFENIGVRKNFYEKPIDDAIIYTKNI